MPAAQVGKVISYLRHGLRKRASGTIVATDPMNWLTKVKPCRADWRHVWVSIGEIASGKEKPAYTPKPYDPNAEKKPRKKRTPKPGWVLLPCPFCGSEAEQIAGPDYPTQHVIRCKNRDHCGASVAEIWLVAPACEIWNKRQPQQPYSTSTNA